MPLIKEVLCRKNAPISLIPFEFGMTRKENNMSKRPFPWEDRPKDAVDPIWRYSLNPVMKRNPTSKLSQVYNSSLVPYEDGYIGIFRAEPRDLITKIFLGRSKDGLTFDLDEEPIHFVYEDGRMDDSQYQYDPRLIKIGGTYYIVYCDDFANLASISIGYTKDFKTFIKLAHPFPPDSRNGVLFPQKINGEYLMLYRIADSAAAGDIYLARSKDLRYWGEYSLLMKRTPYGWGKKKIGGGCTPILTKEGWLLIYHGVMDTCNGLIYSIGGAILDKDDPSIVKYRSKAYLLRPERSYETTGHVGNVCFPCSALVDEETGRLAIYYGASDDCICLGFSTIDILLDYIKNN